MAKKYKVIALSVGGLFNKIFHSGDTVSESAFPPGNADKLVKQGFLVPAAVEAKESEEVPAAVEAKAIDSISTKEIKKQLTELGIEFDKNSSKEELFALLPESL